LAILGAPLPEYCDKVLAQGQISVDCGMQHYSPGRAAQALGAIASAPAVWDALRKRKFWQISRKCMREPLTLGSSKNWWSKQQNSLRLLARPVVRCMGSDGGAVLREVGQLID
jgi:hypothetical protein